MIFLFPRWDMVIPWRVSIEGRGFSPVFFNVTFSSPVVPAKIGPGEEGSMHFFVRMVRNMVRVRVVSSRVLFRKKQKKLEIEPKKQYFLELLPTQDASRH